jgi:HEAT repeat protein
MKSLPLVIVVALASPVFAQADEIVTIDQCFPALKSDDGDRRAEAGKFLATYFEAAQEALTRVLQDPEQQTNAEIALRKMVRGTLPPLIKGLGSSSRSSRRRCAKALSMLGPDAAPAVAALGNALADESKTVRLAAARTLGTIGKESAPAVPQLAKALKDASSTVRRSVARALGSIGPAASAAVPALMKALAFRDEDTREAAALALGGIGRSAQKASNALATALRDEVLEVRLAAAQSLGKLDRVSAEAMSGLARRAKSDPSTRVRAAAAASLKRLQK